MGSNGTGRRELLLGQLIAHHHLTGTAHALGGTCADVGGLLSGYDPDLDGALRVELDKVLAEADRVGPGADPDALASWIAERLAGEDMAHSRQTLWALLGGDDRLLEEQLVPRSTGRLPGREDNDNGHSRRRLCRLGAVTSTNLIIVTTVAVTWVVLWLPAPTPPQVSWSRLALEAFALWCLGQRAGALWDEYVLNLHRLGLDEPRFLPRPPRTSQFYDEWARDGGRTQIQDRNIYRQKFNAYYGRSVADSAQAENFRLHLDTLFPVFLTAAVLSVCWAAVLWDDRFLQTPETVWDVMKYAFLGAYVFIAQMLLRRFFASDLRPSAYTSAVMRITVVLISVPAVYQVLEISLGASAQLRRWEAVVAFTVGFLPLVATQLVVRAASAPMRISVPSLDQDYPLSQLDGMGIWYAARLAEENIDDMQNLVTANLVEVILHTRLPIGRLIDWVDQAHLFLHLDRVERGIRENRRARRPKKIDAPVAKTAEVPIEPSTAPTGAGILPSLALVGESVGPSSRAGTRTRTVLRQLGIRTATDLITAFPPGGTEPLPGGCAAGATHCDPDGAGCVCVDQQQIQTLVRILSEEQGLIPVWNWQDRGIRVRSSRHRPHSGGSCATRANPVLERGTGGAATG